jgi:hypothetical protein
MTKKPPVKVWITDEQNPRVLRAKGRSAIDPDVLVAFPETGSEDCCWIIDGGGGGHDGKSQDVVGAGPTVKARPVIDQQS